MRSWIITVSAALAVTPPCITVLGPIALAAPAVPGLIAPCTSVFAAPAPPGQKIKTVLRPTGLFDSLDSIIGCAGNAEFSDLRWSTWGQAEAVGTGEYLIASCIPGCSASKRVFDGKVRLVLSKPVHVMQDYRLFDVWGSMSAQLTGPSPKLGKASKHCTPDTCVAGVLPETVQRNEHWTLDMAKDLASVCKEDGCTITTVSN